MSILDRARAMRAKYITLAQNAPDELLSSGDYLSVFDSLCGDGSLIPARSVRRHDGQLYRANVDCWDRADNSPNTAPTLWTQITLEEWPDWVQPPVRTMLTASATRSPTTANGIFRRSTAIPQSPARTNAGGANRRNKQNGGTSHAGLFQPPQSRASAGV